MRYQITDRMLAIAHRAGNHLETLQAAIGAGADLIEADVWLYRGRLEVRHRKTLGPLPVLWDRWELAMGRGPRLDLETLVRAVPPGAALMLDLKGTNRRLAGAVRTVMDGAGDGRPYTVCSRNWALLDEFQQRANVRVVHSVGSAGQLRALRQRLAHRQVGAISIHRRLLTPELVQSLREHGVLIMTWPVNTPALLDRLAAWGVHGAIIDDLTVLRGVTARPMAAPRVP